MNRFDNTKDYMKDTINVSASVIAVLLLLKVFDTQTMRPESSIAKSLIEQAQKWYLLSRQDKVPLTSYQHINYAMAYLNGARHVSSDTKLEQVSGIDVHYLYKKIDELQRQVGKTLNQKQNTLKAMKKSNHQKSTWLN